MYFRPCRRRFLFLNMGNSGWIKLHRQLLDNPISTRANWAWLWITLLLLANHEEKKIIWNGKEVMLSPGSFLTGRKALSKQTGIPQTTIERALTFFEEIGHQIGQQKTKKFRIITILNWGKYQIADIKADNKRTTNGQQTDTDKKYKKLKKEVSQGNEMPTERGLKIKADIAKMLKGKKVV